MADRFGVWGPYGAAGVAWGDFGHFTAYTQRLTRMVPAGLAPSLAWMATVAEVVLALGLFMGWHTRIMAGLSGALLLLFAVCMTVALGVKAPLDYSVFTAAAGAFLLACSEQIGFGVDEFSAGVRRNSQDARLSG